MERLQKQLFQNINRNSLYYILNDVPISAQSCECVEYYNRKIKRMILLPISSRTTDTE